MLDLSIAFCKRLPEGNSLPRGSLISKYPDGMLGYQPPPLSQKCLEFCKKPGPQVGTVKTRKLRETSVLSLVK
jgi:hypothetical protein